ncbi:MAG: CHRD domain-containing protein [Bacteroidota bacterium]|nr:CHRD domain-containing protein [Bacteroidota bacterium]
MKTFKHIFLVLTICSFTFFACKKDHDDPCIKAKKGLAMTGAQEVPAHQTAGHGKVDVSYNKCDKMLTFTISWADLAGNPVGSHIHGTAPKGVNAPVLYNFTSSIPKTTSGTFTDSVKVDGITIKEDSLLAGFYYLNIHTPKYPGGEIRAQIEF